MPRCFGVRGCGRKRFISSLPVAFEANLLGSAGPSRSSDNGGIVSSMFMRLRSSAPVPEITKSTSDRQHCAVPASDPSTVTESSTREPQYNRLLEVRDEV